MDNADFNIVLDISSILWDKNDYQDNKHEYYNLIGSITMFLEKLEQFLERGKNKVLLRTKLLNEMINGFPFSILPNEFYALVQRVYRVIANIGSNILEYPEKSIQDLISIPNIVNEYYTDTVKEEINYLLTQLHLENKPHSIYFSYEYLWKGEDEDLKIELDEEYSTHKTIISDDKDEIEAFFKQFTPIFEHNPKHNKTKHNEDKDSFVARLSCYNGEDNDVPQKLLDEAFLLKDCYYNYDGENEVWVIFRCHSKNKYHAYDENNSENIPNKIRKEFNK